MWKVNTPILFSTNLLCPFTSYHEGKGKIKLERQQITAWAVVPSIEHPLSLSQRAQGSAVNKASFPPFKKPTVSPHSFFITEEMLLIASNCEATV